MRFRGADAATVQAHIRYAQSKSKIPLLIASNPEMGGFGSVDDGTLVCTHLQAGSHPDASIARDMGRVAGIETAALGCNWAFAPIVDIHHNWRNTVVATRAFGNTPEVVIERAKAYFDGISESKTVCAIKHFPGDGVDERDQHVVTTWNTLGVDEWHASYGRVYRELIDHGVQSIMAGHIGAPELSRKLPPRHRRRATSCPATLAPELLQDLLRGELGFNGVILTDASPMVGLTSAMKRRDLVPATIAAGCDMFLFFRNADEDFRYMLDGYRNGVITEARLQEALERILGLKAVARPAHDAARGARPRPGSAGRRGLRRAPRHRGGRRRQDRDARQGHPAQPAAAPRDAPADPPVRDHRAGGLHRHRPDGRTSASRRKSWSEPASRCTPSRMRGSASRRARRASTSTRVLQEEAERAYAEKYDAAIVFANVSGFAQEATAPHPLVRADGGRDPVVRHRGAHGLRVAVAAQPPDRRADGQDPDPRARAEPRGDPRGGREDPGQSPFQGTFNENVFCDTFGTRL